VTAGKESDMTTIGRIGLVALLAVALLAGGAEAKAKRRASRASSGDRPDATLTLESKSVAVGVGWSWGHGTLRYRGRSYPFKIDGLSVNAVGVSESDATGYVYSLKNLNDFEGTYTAIEAAGTLGGGKGIASMKNGNGVRITLHSTRQGVEAKAAPEGVKITLR
jgi:hypothetical protein